MTAGATTYTYDANGNRTALNSTTYNYHTNTNRIKDVADSGSQIDFQYDDYGNLINDFLRGRKYHYDWNNRLTEVDDYFYTWYGDHPTSPEEANFRVENEWLKFRARNNTGWKQARKYIKPTSISGATITFEFKFNRVAYEDMDLFTVYLEDSTAGTGFNVHFYRRGNRRMVASQFSPSSGTEYIYEEYGIPAETGEHTMKLEIIPGLPGVLFYYDGVYKGGADLDPAIQSVNSIKMYHAEAYYRYDDFKLTQGSSMIYEDHFDGPVTDSRPSATMAYNAAGERAKKTNPDGTSLYIMGGGQIMAAYNGNGSLRANFIYGNGRRMANAFGAAGNKYYYHNDMLGSVRRLVRQNQTFVYERDYYPYGSDRRAAGATHLPSPEHFPAGIPLGQVHGQEP